MFMLSTLKKYLVDNHNDTIMQDNNKSSLLEVDYESLNNILGEEYDLTTYSDYEYITEQLKLLANRGYDDEKVSVAISEMPQNIELRNIDAENIGQFFSTTAMVKSITEIDPVLRISRYKCSQCGKSFTVDLRPGEEAVLPTKCGCGNKDFEFDLEKSVFQNEKYLTLEEPLESRRDGLTRRFTAHITGYEASSAYTLKAGDVCEVNGRVEAQKPLKGASKDRWNFVLELEHIKRLGYSFDDIELTEEDIREVEELSQNPDIFNMLRDSIAPSIYGFESVKEGVTLQLFEGNRKDNDADRRNRSSVHILIVGEPGLGKSEFSNCLKDIAPKVIVTSGANTSHAGLTVSVNRDERTGKWSAEAGAVVLADSGLLVIDEFDKLSFDVQTGLNEPMENQTASISKAGLVQSMSARTSVLAVANPKDGVFNDGKQLNKQLDMPTSTLSRFDLVYVMKDTVDSDADRALAAHILNQDTDPTLPVIDKELFCKYVAHAKNTCKPVLSDEAKNMIIDFYDNTRQKAAEDGDSKPITPRDLKAIERLSVAYCKLHLRDLVTVGDAEEAIRIYSDSLDTLGLTPLTAGKVSDESNSRNELEAKSRLTELFLYELEEWGDWGSIPRDRLDSIREDVLHGYGFREGVGDDLFKDARRNARLKFKQRQ